MHDIDIIIPVKGRPHVLAERSLPSLRAQTFTSFEVILVDDGSNVTDAQAIQDISSKFADLNIRILKNQGESGAAGARNFGFEQSEAPLVLWFDSDDVLLPNKLDLSISLLNDGQHDFAITRAQHVQHGTLLDSFWGNPQPPGQGRHAFHFPFQTMCALFSRDFLEKNGIRWADELSAMNDWEFSNRCLIESQSWIFSSLVTAHYHVPSKSSGSIGTNLTPAKIQSQRAAIKTIQKLMQSRGLRHSLLDQLRVRRHLFHLWRCALFVKK